MRVNFEKFKSLPPELRPEIRICPEVIEVYMNKQQLVLYDCNNPQYVGGGVRSKKLWENPSGVRDEDDVIYRHSVGSPRVKVPPVEVVKADIEARIEEKPYYVEGIQEGRLETTWILRREEHK